MSFAISASWLEAVMLAAVRMTAFVLIAPPFSYNAFPARIKAMLAIGLAIAVSPNVGHGFVSPDTGGFVLDLMLEAAMGAALGFLVLLAFAAIQSAGFLVDLFGGFQIAQAFDPQALINGAQFTKLFQLTALALLFTSDGYQLLLGGLARSFTAVPVGGGLDLSKPVAAMTTATTQFFLASLQIAGPLIVVLFLADAGLGLLNRVAASLNAFSLGFPLKILLTLSLAGVVFLVLPGVVASLTGQAAHSIVGGN
jgi:flagellar biosynthetic protein FliR